MIDYVATNAFVSQYAQHVGMPRKRFRLFGEPSLAFGTNPFHRPDVSPPER